MHTEPVGALVRRGARDDVDPAARALAQAFDGYAWTDWTVAADDHLARVEAQFTLLLGEVALEWAQWWVVCADDGTVQGAAVWLDPRREVPGHVWATVAGRTEQLAGAAAERARLADEICAPLREPLPGEPAWLLATIGVVESARGRGVASALLAAGLAEVDSSGLAAQVETSSESNVALYERFGFEVTGRVQVPDGGPRVWGLVRPARPAWAASAVVDTQPSALRS